MAYATNKSKLLVFILKVFVYETFRNINNTLRTVLV